MSRWLLLQLCLCFTATGWTVPNHTEVPSADTAIRIIPQDGFNLVAEEQFDDHYVIVKVNPPVHHWFAGTFTNLPTDKEVTIGLSMDDNDTRGNKADVSKWKGLVPVMTYADPTRYEAYEWYQKDQQGRWVSGDILKQGDAKYAGTGKTPYSPLFQPSLPSNFYQLMVHIGNFGEQ